MRYAKVVEAWFLYGARANTLVLCLTNRFAKMRRIFRCRQGAMTSSGVHHARKSNAARRRKKTSRFVNLFVETQH